MLQNKKQEGKIIPHGVSLEKHEMDTILVFTEIGYDVELIRPSCTPNSRRPDFLMGEQTWEAKSPQGNSKSTLEHVFKKAARQSKNIIIDLRRTKISDTTALSQLEKLWSNSKSIQHLKIVTKHQGIVDFKR